MPRPARHRKHELAQALRTGSSTIMFYTYVPRSLQDNNLYDVGWTTDLRNRIKLHSSGQVDATKTRIPLQLEYYEACRNREKAIEREKYFKTGFGRRFLKSRL